jgi:hypothetical protein
MTGHGRTRYARMTMKTRVAWTLALLAWLLGGCADLPLEPAAPVAELAISASVAATPIDKLVVAVTAADIAEPLFANLRISAGVAAGTVRVPAGAARTFAVRAFDTRGTVTHHGSATVDVAIGANPPLTIRLYAAAGELPIDVVIAEYTVTVDPGSVTLDVGETTRLSALVTRGDGATVDGRVQWASLDPAVASVDRDGVVTARAEGTARIAAVFGGAGAIATITVQGGGGARIVFMGSGPGSWYTDIFSIRPDGTGVRRLTDDEHVDHSPALSPDGRRIAYVSERDLRRQIFLMNADGTGVRRLTHALSSHDGHDYDPAWSHDGRWIAFISTREGDPQLYRVRPDGTGLTRVLATGELAGRTCAALAHPAWHPAELRLVAVCGQHGTSGTDLLLVDVGAGEVTRIAGGGANHLRPRWHPDGERIILQSDRSGRFQIWSIRADGTALTQLRSSVYHEQYPVWSPDGTQFAYSMQGEVYVADADGTAARRLAPSGYGSAHPDWR